MLKATVFVSLMLIASVLCVRSLSCGSCGTECAPACGTRRFRSCCFNYLRKKRQDDHDYVTDNAQQSKVSEEIVYEFPKDWSDVLSYNFNLNGHDDTLLNRLEALYEKSTNATTLLEM